MVSGSWSGAGREGEVAARPRGMSPARIFFLAVGFFGAFVVGVLLGLAVAHLAGIVPSDLPAWQHLAAAAFFSGLLYALAIIVGIWEGRSAQGMIIFVSAVAVLDVLAAFVFFRPPAPCIQQELPLIPALVGAPMWLAQEITVVNCPAVGLFGFSPLQAVVFLSPAALVATMCALSVALHRPALFVVTAIGALLSILGVVGVKLLQMLGF